MTNGKDVNAKFENIDNPLAKPQRALAKLCLPLPWRAVIEGEARVGAPSWQPKRPPTIAARVNAPLHQRFFSVCYASYFNHTRRVQVDRDIPAQWQPRAASAAYFLERVKKQRIRFDGSLRSTNGGHPERSAAESKDLASV